MIGKSFGLPADQKDPTGGGFGDGKGDWWGQQSADKMIVQIKFCHSSSLYCVGKGGGDVILHSSKSFHLWEAERERVSERATWGRRRRWVGSGCGWGQQQWHADIKKVFCCWLLHFYIIIILLYANKCFNPCPSFVR